MKLLLNILSLLYLLAFAASGYAVARLLFPRDRFVKRLLYGMTAGLVMLLWLPVLLAFIIDFTLAAQLIALAAAVGLGILCAVLYGKKLNGDEAFAAAVRARAKFRIKDERALLLTCVPIIIIGAVLLSNHTIVAASDGSLHVGQCTYGDLCMHLGFISSISVQKTFPPMYSILPDTKLGYPFLCDSISSTFYTLGSTLRFAALLPALYAYVIVTLGVYLFFEQWFKRNSVAVIATWLFFLGGGFGFFYFFDNAKTYAGLTSGAAWESWLADTYGINAQVDAAGALDMGKRLMEGFYKTPTNYVSLGLRWVNSIADMLVPQRATLFGWALLFPALQLLHRAAFEKEHRLFICLGVLAGAMPLVHTHSFFALGLISVFLIAALFIRKLVGKGAEDDVKMLKSFLLFGIIAVALAAPQLFGFTFRQSSAGGFLKYHFNWCNVSDSWLWFYIKNLGLIFILMPIAFLYTKSENKLFYGGSLLIWALCEFVVFQPNTYDNNKLLFVWFAMTCGIVAELLMKLYDRLAEKRAVDNADGKGRTAPLSHRVARYALFVIIIGSMLLSGVMTIAREYVSADHIGIKDGKVQKVESGYQAVSAQLVEATEFIKANTAPDATFLTATNHNNAVAMLTGRNIVCGAGTFLYFHGVDYQGRSNNVRLMYEQPEQFFDSLANEYGVDYVLISSWERGSYNVNTAYFDRLEKIYDNGGVTIYRTGN